MVAPDNNDINVLIRQAFQLLEKEKRSEARTVFSRIMTLPVDDIEDLSQLGMLATLLGEKIIAINVFLELVDKTPDVPDYMLSLAQAYINNSMLAQAEVWTNKVLEIKPDSHHAYIKLSYIALHIKKYTEAVEFLEKAMQLKPSDASIYRNLVTAYIHLDKPEEAYKHALKLNKLLPNNSENHHFLGRVLNGMGRFDEAIKSYEKAIQLDVTQGVSYYDLANTKKFSLSNDADVAFIAKAEKALQKSMPSTERACIHYSLGKAHNDCKQWDKAFGHYKQGNLIRKPAIDESNVVNYFNKTHKVFNKKLFDRYADKVSDSEVPVFVVGMPRSGSTLIEQIIASHPEASGAGEIGDFIEINKAICTYDKIDSFKQLLLKSLDSGSVNELIDGYLQVLRNTRDDASRVVNKMLDNYLFLGIIHLLFPKAHIIHAVRSPLDTALSCYFQAFETVDWANDLDQISKQYKFYRKVMSYWESVLPEGSIIEVRYEQMVAEPEQQAKRLIESIGLDWDPVCLEYYKDKRSVSTASMWQVRQPMYKSSRKRWVNYAAHMQGLATNLYEYLDEGDIEAFAEQGINLKKKSWISKVLG